MCGVCGNMSTGRTRAARSRPRRAGPRSAQRRRVAGDVDDPLRRGLDDPAHDLLREARARRVDHARRRACRPARRARASPGGCRRRRSAALVISLRRALSIASATAGSTISTPITSRARAASDSADRADAAVEVEDALVPAQVGELDRGAVEHLGHLRVRLEERLGRDQELELAELLAQPLGAGEPLRRRRPGWSRRARRSGSRTGPRSRRPPRARRVSIAPGRGDEPDLQLAGAAALADDEVAQQAALVAAVPGAAAPARAPTPSTCSRAALPRSEASRQSVDRHDLVEAAGRVEAAHELAVRAGAERVLELVAVAPLLDGGHDRVLLEPVELADPAQRVADLLGLDLELALVGEHLPRRAGMVGDVGAIRSGDGSRISTARASAYARLDLPTTARTRSPGSAPATKTT